MTAALLALALAAGPSGQSWSFDTGPAPEVAIANVSGPIAVVGVAAEKAEVELAWEGGDGSRAAWTVVVEGAKGKLSAQVCCGPCGSSTHSCGEGPRPALTVHIPGGSKLSVNQVSGAVSVEAMAGEVEVHTVSGKVKLAGAQAAVRLDTVSGPVEVALAKAAPVKLTSVSGNIAVRLAAGQGAQVNLSTVSGKLNGRSVGIGSAQATVGAGGPAIVASSVSGDLDVR